MPRPEKVQKVQALKEMVEPAQALFLLDFTGLSVPEITELRKKLREKKAVLKVVKNTLARRALQETGHRKITEFLVGPNALVIAYEDVVEPIKVVFDFAKEVGKGQLRVGEVQGEVLEGKDLERLSKLPPLSEMRAKAVGALSAPLYGLVNTLQGLLTSLVWTLEALRQKREEG